MRQIQEMDADVLLIEAARSKMELLEDWKRTGYENEIGPGCTTSTRHGSPRPRRWWTCCGSPRRCWSLEQIWVDPDCGLKRRYEEAVEPSLKNMVAAAKQLREELVPSSR